MLTASAMRVVALPAAPARPAALGRSGLLAAAAPRLVSPQISPLSSSAAGRADSGPLRASLRLFRRPAARRLVAASAQQQQPLTRAPSAELDARAPFLEPLARSFILGVGTGVLLEAGHVALQVLTGSFPGAAQFEPLLVADHVTALASWMALYALEAAAVWSVLKKFDFDAVAASGDISRLTTLPKRMFPAKLRLHTLKRFLSAGAKLIRPSGAIRAAAAAQLSSASSSAAAPEALPTASTSTSSEPAQPAASAFVAGPGEPTVLPPSSLGPIPTSAPETVRPPTRARGASSVVPAPGITGRPKTAPPSGGDDEEPHAFLAKRAKELRDRESYLKNMWYAAALSSNLGDKPVKTQLCGREMVLFRDAEGKAHCVDNTCPHRGAPLSEGWVQHGVGEGKHSCVVCPYHGWALDGQGAIRDVPAAENKGEWPKRPLSDSWPVEEKGGFVWVFYGSKSLPAEERPPIPFAPELEDPEWRPVYHEIEFDCGHFGVFENAIDMAHIHYLHGDSFGNLEKPEIRGMRAYSEDPFSVTAKFTIHNKPVNAFWALFQVPEVHVTAKAFLPSTSLVTFELGAGLNFTTFVSTVPISATKSVNRFALVRKLSSDKTGIFNSPLWDGMARRAMMKIQLEDKEMVEQLRYDQLAAEANVRSDLPQVMFRKLRQQYVDLGYAVPTEKDVQPFISSPARSKGPSRSRC